MAQTPSDFRSDTVTRASATMRQLIAEATVGDDVLDGDPTVQRLEQAAADWLGMEGSLFVPSGTMANQVALGAWTRPGDEIIVQRFAHVTTFEAGAAGYLHGLQSMTVGGETGDFSLEQVRSCVRPTFIHCPPTSLICLEQTHNYAGGRVLPLQVFEEVSGFAREAKIPLHLDGARLANAAVASGVSARTYASHVDSVSLCFSKGLGAPVGSIIAGSGEFLERARLVRKRLGGWMRQSGHLAAAALYALENNVARLAEDHALAGQLAERLGALPGLETEPDLVETNIVMVQVQHPDFDAKALSEALAQEGVLVMPMGERRLRFVTHLDVGPADLERLETAANRLLS